MGAKAPTPPPSDKPKPEPGPATPKLTFNRRIMDLDTLVAINQEIKGPDHVISGNAMHMIVNDLWKLRYLCMALVQAHQKGNRKEVEGLLQKLELIV